MAATPCLPGETPESVSRKSITTQGKWYGDAGKTAPQQGWMSSRGATCQETDSTQVSR
ncbi:MAG: hypothetical protein R3D26_09770 [Cyanobacteriota/Melainabacteria group bacterium]